ncbi:hypothetical protein [Spirosoma flavum]|uniref:Uncharacterized protein n=1 Tax=Spirosoma flavum TaxID=2048557 RepID=A0ABW6AV06_9BACT
MTGTEFYDYLRSYYTMDGQAIYGNYSFKQWLLKANNSHSFQFNGNNPIKSISRVWLVDAKNARNAGEQIDRNWFNTFYNTDSNNDCRASVAVWLLENHDD